MRTRVRQPALAITGVALLASAAFSAPPAAPPPAGDPTSGCKDRCGSARIAGRGADGKPFTKVVAALWLGAADNPANVDVHLFSKPVSCSALQAIGWDNHIGAGIQLLEVKTAGSAPQAYTMIMPPHMPPGTAHVTYLRTKRSADPFERPSPTGTVTLSVVNKASNVTGSFSADFGPKQRLTGTFDAVYCPGGREP